MSILFSKALFPGEVIADQWCVDEPIARGGYAVIYSGFRLDDETPVVIKAPREGVRTFDDVAYERFEREARAVMQLDHPNIVTVLGYGHHGTDVPYIVMEALQGDALTVLLRRGPLPVEDVEHILRQLLAALGFSHSHGLVHRDLKPGNVFVCQPGGGELVPPYSVKLLDFGLVKPMQENMAGMKGRLTRQGQYVGTPGYMAPELFLFEPVTTAVDVYGAGVLAYEMVTGTVAFDGAPIDRMAKQQSDTPTPVPPALAKLPILDIVRKMMARDPNERYSTCDEVIAALDEHRAHPARSRFVSLWTRGRQP